MGHRVPPSRGPLRLTLSVLLPLLAACAVEGPAGTDPADHLEAPADVKVAAPADAKAAAARARVSRLHTEPVTGARFPVPSAGVSVEVRHFDPGLPARKFKHQIRLFTASGTAVLIDVWNNPQGLDLQAWFDDHLGFLVDDHTVVSARTMTHARVAGILLQQPPSPQASSQVVAVFSHRDQVFRVTGIDPEGDAAARALFDRVIDEIELGVGR